MKTDIHPKYNRNLQITCTCGNMFIAGSTKAEIKTEICSACHPFYTGQQKLVDTAGRVDKYMERVKKAQKLNEKTVSKVDKKLDEMFHEEKSDETPEDNTAKVATKKSILKMTQDNEEKVAAAEPEKKVEDKEEKPETDSATVPKKDAKKTAAKKATAKKTTKKAA